MRDYKIGDICKIKDSTLKVVVTSVHQTLVDCEHPGSPNSSAVIDTALLVVPVELYEQGRYLDKIRACPDDLVFVCESKL